MKNKSINKLSIACLVALTTVSSTWACNASHVLGVGSGNTATAYTISANTMDEGGMYVGMNYETLRNKFLTDAAILSALNAGSEHLHGVDAVNTFALSASYGITNDLTVNVQLPFTSRKGIRAGEDDGGGPEVHRHNDVEELGDMAALFQYKVYDQDKFKVALLGGFKAPTGVDDDTFEGEILETDLQSGTGSWDFFAGVAVTKDFEDFSLHSDFLYKYNGKGARSSELGDVFTYNVALSYNLIGHESHKLLKGLDEENHSGYSLDTFVELNGEIADEDHFDGVQAANTGHHVIYATTGLSLSTEENYSLFFAISVPVYQDMKGEQNYISYRSTFGIGKSF
ncbi:transporter [Sulfurimonas sp.]|nr:transporter [Sulfurimonas sp.]